jgi:hypothetical protein
MLQIQPELATAEERKPAPSAQEVTSLRNAQQILKNTNASTASVTTNTKTITNKSVPWWTDELTVMRKRTNALRSYQRTRKHEGLREQRKTIYLAEKARYEAAIKREKILFWKEYCNMTSSNPWNEVYKLATGLEKGQHTNNNSAKA